MVFVAIKQNYNLNLLFVFKKLALSLVMVAQLPLNFHGGDLCAG